MNKKVTIVLGILNVLTLTLTLYLGMQYTNIKRKTSSEIKVNNVKVQDYKKATQSMTPKRYDRKVSEYVTKENINLVELEDKLTEKLTEGFTQAYNNTHTKEEFETLEDELPKKVGYLLASKILNLAYPAISQSGEVPLFDKLNSINISYSSYDVQTNTLNILIFVNYNISPNMVQTTDGNANNSNTNRKAVYTVTYNVGTRSYSNLKYNELGGSSNAN